MNITRINHVHHAVYFAERVAMTFWWMEKQC